MSDNDSSTDSDKQLPDLSALSFAPAWARDKPKGQSRSRQNDGGERRDRGGRNQNRDRGQQGERRGGGGGGDRRRNSGSGGRDSRDQRGYRGNQGGRDNRRDQRGGRERKPYVEAPEGMVARIMPIEEGLDALAKDIGATGRTHSVFDIAWLVLGELDRFHVIFESEDQLLYRSRKDHSLWLSQRECLTHFWNSGLSKKYYEEEVVEVDPPKGNFQSVARCGLSGTLIGPPNHHAYQKTLLDLHREKFSNMDLARYKSKVVMEHGEEAVQAWLDSMTKHTRWRPITEKIELEEAADGEVVKVEGVNVEEEAAQVAEVSEKAPELVEASEAQVTETSEEVVEEAETPTEPSAPAEEVVIILDTHIEVEQHFMSHGFDTEFESGKVMSVLANVPTKMIDPSLFTLLKTTVTEERRYPGKLASILCRQMSGRHLAVFKWKKHLHCGPARPRNVSKDTVMAERPTALFKWVSENPGGQIDAMWKELLAADVDDETRHQWYHDLHWLINEGILLLFSDGKLHAAKELAKKSQKPAAKKTAKKAKSKKSKSKEEKSPEVKPAVTTESSPEEEVENPELETVEFAVVEEETPEAETPKTEKMTEPTKVEDKK